MLVDEDLLEVLELIAKMAMAIGVPVYLKVITAKGDFEVELADPQNVIDDQEASAQLNTAVRTRLLSYNGELSIERIDNTTVLVGPDYVIAIFGQLQEYCHLFALMAYYHLDNKVTIPSYLGYESVDYLYLATSNPKALFDFVLLGFPGVRRTYWKLPDAAAANSIFLPKDDGAICLVVRSSR